MRPTARARAAPRRRDRPAIAWLPPRLRRHVRGRFERLEIGHEFPDGIGRQQTAIRRHAVRLAVTNRLEDLRIGAAVAPAAVAQAGAHPTHRPAAVTPDRPPPASRNQSPPIPASTATYCLPSGPV